MRRILIDTDCGSDDAVAIILALKSKDVHVEAITTVCGNVPIELATKNALMTIEVAKGQQPPLFVGCSKPLMKELITAVNIHGSDGMGDLDLIHPTLIAEREHAVDAIIRVVSKYPDDIEIVTLGPVTNIAMAIMKEPETMKKVRHIYSMGTSGFGKGNITPVAEFNVYVDATAYDIMLNAGIPITIIGFDVCLGDAALNKGNMELLLSSNNEIANFAVKCNKCLLEYNLKYSGDHIVDLPDAVAMGVALWEDLMLDSVKCYCHTCLIDPVAYGQVILDDSSLASFFTVEQKQKNSALICKKIDTNKFKDRLLATMLS